MDASNPPIIKLCDFGLAKRIEREKTENGLLHTNTLVGSPGYLGPEIVGKAIQVGIVAAEA